MILVAVALLGLLTVPLTGGRLSTLGQLKLSRAWAVWASIAIQLWITTAWAHGPNTIAGVLHLVTYALSAWCICSNRRLPGVWLVAIGGASNVLAIGTNGGTMPATAWAWRTSGLAAVPTAEFHNSGISSGSRLWFLGDVFAVPRGWPFANVFSLGDVIVVLGLMVFAHSVCRSDDRARSALQFASTPRA